MTTEEGNIQKNFYDGEGLRAEMEENGRVIQEDTYYGDGLNLYSYCQNNPVRYVEPSGFKKNVRL